MIEPKGKIIVGILGQWASGKTAAARTLIQYLGGEGEVAFITDRELFASQAVNHVLELEDSKVTLSIEDGGRQRLDGEHATIWLGPGEDLKTVDLGTLRFDVHDDVIPAWLNRARVELGHQICERSAGGKPIVIEAGFGKNPFDHTISDLFTRLEEAGVEPKQVKWIIVEAGFDKRSERNQKRRAGVSVDIFARYAVDGGDLGPEHQNRLEEQGTIIKRVPNDHDDIGRFRADIIATFEEMLRPFHNSDRCIFRSSAAPLTPKMGMQGQPKVDTKRLQVSEKADLRPPKPAFCRSLDPNPVAESCLCSQKARPGDGIVIRIGLSGLPNGP